MKISEQIQDKIDAIYGLNMYPRRIYLGQETEYKLKAELNYELSPQFEAKTVYGLPYFVVNVREHLDVTMAVRRASE